MIVLIEGLRLGDHNQQGPQAQLDLMYVMEKHKTHKLIALAAVVLVLELCNPGFALRPFKVLVVMSYEESFPWCREIREGIDTVLGDSSEIRYFYMDTKTNLHAGPERAKDAYALFQKFAPDGVIAVDDNAQGMFVVPFLKDKVRTPVMFCGVNARPEKYGYPTSNVSGILERLHIRESIAFAKQVSPRIETVGFIMKAGPAADQVRAQVEKEKANYPARFIAFMTPRTLKEVMETAKKLSSQCDLLFIETLQGVADSEGIPVSDGRAMPIAIDAFGKPTAGSNRYAVEFGILSAVVKTGQEQGTKAAQMLFKAMTGTPVSEIPIVRNLHGKRMINVNSLIKLGIKPKSIILRGSELVRTDLQPEK